jgi:hypothetical protein
MPQAAMTKAFGQQNRMQKRNFKTDASGFHFDGLGSPSYEDAGWGLFGVVASNNCRRSATWDLCVVGV